MSNQIDNTWPLNLQPCPRVQGERERRVRVKLDKIYSHFSMAGPKPMDEILMLWKLKVPSL